MKSVIAVLVLATNLFCQAAVAQSALSLESSKAIEARVAALLAKAESTHSVVMSGKKIIADNDPKKILAAASKETETLLSRYKDIINEFKAGGEINTLLLSADKELDGLVKKFGANPKTRAAAKVLEGVKNNFAGLDKKRDLLLQEASRLVRTLEGQKEEIEAWVVVGKYQEVERALTAMFDGLGSLNEEARAFTSEMDKTRRTQVE